MCCSELEALLGALPAIELAGGATSVSAHRCLAVRACACACVRVCVCACVFACVCNRHANERGAQTNLPEPVRSAAVQMSYFWDRQKEKVAMQCGPLTHFIPKPAMDVWERAKDRFGDIVAQGPCACACIIQTCWIPLPMHLRPTCMHARARARALTHTHARTPTDGVHPNEHGYRVFSDFLGQEIAELLRAQVCLRPFLNTCITVTYVSLTPRRRCCGRRRSGRKTGWATASRR